MRLHVDTEFTDFRSLAAFRIPLGTSDHGSKRCFPINCATFCLSSVAGRRDVREVLCPVGRLSIPGIPLTPLESARGERLGSSFFGRPCLHAATGSSPLPRYEGSTVFIKTRAAKPPLSP